MTKEQLENLINRYLLGNATKQEVEIMEKYYSYLINQDTGDHTLKGKNKNRVQNRVYQRIHDHIQREKNKKRQVILSGVAAVLLFLISGYLYVNWSPEEFNNVSSPTMDITIASEADQRSLLLHDGTYVLLSPGAKLTYPSTFNDSVRSVELTGEAWFDVQRDTTHPFQVRTGEVITTVLGTSFSVNATSMNKEVEVKVTSGTVKVNNKKEELAILQINDELVYQSGKLIVMRGVKKIEEEKTNLPKPGAFKLANVAMEEAALFLEKRWNKEVVFDNKAIKTCPLYASFNAEDPMEEVLMILCRVTNSKYKITNDKITIYGKGCNKNK